MPEPIKFWDVSKRLDWFRARALTRKIFERPEILGEMRSCIEAKWGGDPSKLRSILLWRKLLALTPCDFAQTILADNPEAEEMRESYPPYVAMTPVERAEYIEASRRELAVA